MTAGISQKPPIFIGGAARSGTTLLRVILDSHPNIACGPELKVSQVIAREWRNFRTIYANIIEEYFLTPEDVNRLFANMILELLEKYRLNAGKLRIAEKSPNNVKIFPHLHEMFPASPLIHLIRDGRDVVASLLTMDWETPSGKPIEYTRDAGKAAQFWMDAVTAGRKFSTRKASNSAVYFEIRYEDIVAKPERTLRNLFEFIGEPWDPGVLKYYDHERNLAGESSAEQVRGKLYRSAVGRWRHDLDSQQLQAVKAIAGDLLVKLGYATDLSW